jgi:hypothetical protein
MLGSDDAYSKKKRSKVAGMICKPRIHYLEPIIKVAIGKV